MTRPGALGRQARDAAEQGIAALRPRGWRWLLILAIACTLLAVVAARLSGPSGPWLWNWDLPKIDFPLAALFHAALRDGHLPLWSDDLGLGFPLYAEGQIGAFYPPNWLLYQLPPLVALDVSRVLHLAMAGVGAAILTGRLSGSRTGSLAAAAVVVLGGAITAKLQWTNLVVAYAWLPWVLVPLVRRPAPTALGLAAAGLAWGLQALAGHPNTWLLTGLAAVVLLAAIAPRPRTLGRIVAFGSLGGAVGAVQLVPTLLLTSLSVRSGGLPVDDLFTSSATPFDPLLLGFAGAFARWSSGGLDVANAWYPDGGFALLEAGMYVGLPAVALAAVGLTARRARPFALLAAVMVAIPIVAALRPAAWSEIPILDGLRSPTRSYLVVQLAIAVIAGIGVGRLGRSTGAWRRAALAVGGLGVFYVGTLALAALAGGLFEGVLRWSATGLSVEGAGLARVAALDTLGAPTPQLLLELAVGAAAVGLVALGSSPGLRRAAAALAIVVPLALLSPAVNRVEPAAMSSFEDAPLVAAIRAAGPHRVLLVDEPVWHDAMPDQLAAVGVAGVDMFSSLDLAASDALRRDMEHGADAVGLQQLAGVDLVVRFGAAACPDGGGETVPFGFAPAPWLTGVARLCRAVVPAVPPAWIPERAVIAVTGGGSPLRPADAQLDVAAANAGATSATVMARDPGRGAFAVDAPVPGWVWIDRAWWPGWIVQVDGATVTPFRAAAGQLVPVASGRHVIEQRLVPWDAFLGLGAGILALVVAGIWLLALRRRRAGESAAGESTADVRPRARGAGWSGALLLVGLFGIALIARLALAIIVLPESGHRSDLAIMTDWAHELAANGPATFYRPDAGYFADYPPAYLYVLWITGVVGSAWSATIGGPDVTPLMLKLPFILADLGVAAVLMLLTRHLYGRRAGIAAAAVFLLNPAVILVSTVWAQNDSIATLAVVSAVYLLVVGRTEAAAVAAVLAMLVKFQYGFAIPIVVLVGLRRHLTRAREEDGGGSERDWRRVVYSIVAGVATLIVVCWPFRLVLFDPANPAYSLVSRFIGASRAFPGVTQNAFNLWMNPFFGVISVGPSGLTEGHVVDDTAVAVALGGIALTWQWIGNLLFAVAVLAALAVLLRRTDRVAIVFVALVIAVAFFVLPTRVHERYLYPALALGIPLLAAGAAWRVLYLALSGVLFLDVYWVYSLPIGNAGPGRGILGDSVYSAAGIYLMSAVTVVCMGWLVVRALRPASLKGRGASGGAGSTPARIRDRLVSPWARRSP